MSVYTTLLMFGLHSVKKVLAGEPFGSLDELKAVLSNYCEDPSEFDGGTYGQIEDWDVSQIEDMSCLFDSYIYYEDTEDCDPNISAWDVASVTDFYATFRASSFNQDIGSWDVSSATDFESMFEVHEDVAVFNQNIGGWDVSKGTSLKHMFENAVSFDGDIGGWDVAGVTDFSGMFYGAESFNTDIGGWDVSNSENFGAMFNGAKLFNTDIGGWDVSNSEFFGIMFYNSTFNNDIGDWDVSSCAYFASMFGQTDYFNQDIGGWDVSNPNYSTYSFYYMFDAAISFNQNLTSWPEYATATEGFCTGGALCAPGPLPGRLFGSLDELRAAVRNS